ncbi:hypothetical protein [Ralstonia sp. CP]
MRLPEPIGYLCWLFRRAWREKRITLEINLGDVFLCIAIIVLILRKG